MLNYYIRKIALKSGATRYRSVITNSGKDFKSKTFLRKKDASAWGDRIIRDDQDKQAKGAKSSNITFRRLADEYMKAWDKKDHDRARVVKWWSNQFGDTVLTDISEAVIRQKLIPRVKQAPATYNKYRAVLSALFEFALLQQQDLGALEFYVETNPCKLIKSKPVNNECGRFLTDDEKAKLLKEAMRIGGIFHLKVLIALTTGMRKGELDKLKWSDIDFNRKVALLGKTKNGSPRHTPIPDLAITELQKYYENGNSLIFCSRSNPDKATDFRKTWKTCLEYAKIEFFRWHDLRHDTGSTLAKDGRSVIEIAEILGHKTLACTKRYTHLSTEHKRNVLNDTMERFTPR
jgi:integrase